VRKASYSNGTGLGLELHTGGVGRQRSTLNSTGFNVQDSIHPSNPQYAFDTPTALPLNQEPPRISDRSLRGPHLSGQFEKTFLAVTGCKTKMARLFS